MRITRSVLGSVAIVGLTGDLDAHAAELVDDDVLALVPQHSAVLLDLTEVAHLTSAGLRVLLRLYRQGRSLDTTMVLVGLSAELRRILSATGFLGYFVVADTVSDGIELLNAEADRKDRIHV